MEIQKSRPVALSVLIPVLNDRQFIGECIQSVLDLRGIDVEICVSDNASTDGTWEAICGFASRYSSIKLFRHESRVSAEENWRHVLSMSSGDLVLFLGSDDYLVGNGLVGVVRSMEESPTLAGVALRTHNFSDSSGRVLSEAPPRDSKIGKDQTVRSAIGWFVRHYNHDELIYSVWRRDPLVKALARIRYPAQEPVAWWWAMYAILPFEAGTPRFDISQDVIMMKRYEKVITRAEYPTGRPETTDAQAPKRVSRVLTMARMEGTRRKNTLGNAIVVWLDARLDAGDLLCLIFKTRRHSGNDAISYSILSLPVGRFLKRVLLGA